MCAIYRTRFTNVNNNQSIRRLYESYFLLTLQGWGKGQFGPAYIDLRVISNTDLEQGSWILTSFFIGYSMGSVLEGILHDRVNRKLMFSASLFIWSIVIAGIPWCSIFEAMLCGYILIGILQGILDTGGNTEMLRVWEKRGREAILKMNLIFAVGSVIAPLVVAPFLMDPPRGGNALNYTANSSHQAELTQNMSSISANQQLIYSYEEGHSSETAIPISNYSNSINKGNLSDYDFLGNLFESKSEIYIPFSLSAALSLVASFMYILSYALYSKERTRQTKKGHKQRKARKLPPPIKLCTLTLLNALFFFYCGIDEAYTAFLPTYCVEQFHWSKQEGAFLASLVFISILVARVLTVIFERWIDTLIIIGINFIVMFMSILGLLIVSLYDFDTGVWFLSPLYGFAKSCLFALLLSWCNEYITPMTGNISACFFVTATLGCASNPVILGLLMENDPVWYCYLFLIEIVVVLVIYILCLFLTKYIVRNYGNTYDAEPDIVKVAYAEDDTFLDHKNKEIENLT
ncbi:sodium-dependent glucose transporter 1-like [Pecten maximus]|uniref:sodium-dependent glucose transporter 1-like n=1 Tax=Pecten maximus TaxID=6579 RepID=UPI001458E587|nr:sodium-dependent glucose transporter 1-like [Pecten maximus]